MSVLVTGGAGFIGSHTCVELLEAGFDIVVLDNLSNSHSVSLDRVREITGKNFPFYRCDIRDGEALRAIFDQEKIDAVIHFAALKSPNNSLSSPLEYYDNNIGGTVNLLQVMSEKGCKKIVFSSSATVYGINNTAPLFEDMPVGGTINPYGTTKLYMETILRDTFVSDNEWSVSILRYFNPIGAHESGLIGEDPNCIPTNLMPYITQVAIGKLPFLSVYGNDYDTPDGTCIRDYIHVVDLSLGHIKALQRVLGKSGVDTYNLGTGKGCSVLEVIKAFEEANNISIKYEFHDRRAGDVVVSYSDASKAMRELGWSAERDLRTMCADAWRWQTKNPNGYAL